MKVPKLLLASAMCVTMAVALSGQAPVELKVGDQAPDFTLPGTDGKTHKLSDYRGKGVVLAWYPAAFTGGCTAECKSFRDSGAVIGSYDIAYFMASVDTPEKNAEFAKMEEANFPLLSDPAKTVAAAYGVLNARGTANRWTFYVGPDGVLKYIDKQVQVNTAGQDLAARLGELNYRKK
jgi:thioredoxin-dependent peroxiredoxin